MYGSKPVVAALAAVAVAGVLSSERSLAARPPGGRPRSSGDLDLDAFAARVNYVFRY